MTFTTNYWDRFIAALLKPFVKIKQDNMRLQHAIETDKQAAQQRFMETVLDSNRQIIDQMNVTVAETTSVLKDWLEGFNKIPTVQMTAPPVNDDERLWRKEMESLAREHGKNLLDTMSPYEVEAVMSDMLKGL
jgi:hypothetical protein